MTKIHLRLDVDPFLVKTLDCAEEREAAYRLRHEIFHREHHGRQLPDGRDVDAIDEHCDHLGVFHRGRLTGTYRLNRAPLGGGFYAAERFHLDPLWALDGRKIELGRACVDPAYRSGTTVHLLWRGIAEYVRLAGARFLFGCSSVRVVDPRRVAAIYRALQGAGRVCPRVRVAVREERRFDWAQRSFDRDDPADDGVAELPPLFAMYLKAGARIVAEPARDPYLGCADFLTLLDTEDVSERFTRRYGLGRPSKNVHPADTPLRFPAEIRGVAGFPAFPLRS